MGSRSLNIFIGINDSKFQKGLMRVSKKLTKFGNQMKSVGKSMTRNVSMPLAGIGLASIKLAADFETSMTKIATLVGASAEELRGYESAIKSLSVQTGTSAQQLAEGLFFITSAGFSGQEALDALEVSAKGAALGMGEMSDVSNALTSIMTAYASQGMTAAEAGDLLHETLKQGKFEASEFMGKLGSVIPVAAAAGISMEELGAASATMSKLSGDAAGTLTAMRSLMLGLLKPSEKQKEVLESIGLTTEELSSMMDESLMETLQFLFQNLEGNNEALLNVFGSSKAVTGALSTMGLQAETYATVLDGMNKSQGNVNEGMDTLNKTAGQQFKKTLVELQNVGIELGQRLLPPITKLVKFLMQGVDAFMKLDKSTKAIITGFGVIAFAIGPLVTLGGTLMTVFGSVLGFIAGMSAPIAVVLAAIAGGIYYAITNWEDFKKKLVDVINYFVDLYNESILFRGIIETIIGTFKLLVATGIYFGKTIVGIVQGIGEQFVNIFGGIGSLLKGVFTLDYEEIKAGAAQVMESFVDVFKDNQTLLDAEKELAETASKIFKDGVENTLRGKVDYVTEDDIQGVADKAGEMVQALKDKFKQMFSGSGVAVPGMPEGTMGPPEPPPLFSGGPGGGGDDGVESFADKYVSAMQDIEKVTGEVFGRVDGILSQHFENKRLLIEEDYNRQRQLIEQSTMGEQEKADAIDKLNKDTAKKKKALQIKQAKAEKKMQLFSAIINVASAIAANIANPILAGFIGALGAVQIATIASTPIPALAQGGLAFGETAAIVGDNPNAQTDPEVIAPLSKLQSIMGTQSITVHGVIRGEDIWLTNNRQEKIQLR